MGNSASGDKGRHRHGYHVLRVKDDSPASRAGLRPFFDYIMTVNGIRLNVESATLREQMEASEDTPIQLDVYSTQEQALRKVEMTPTRKWGNGNDGLLGCSIRFCLFDTVNDIVWHVLDIAPESPAEQAGLHAHKDYIIGTPLGIMRGEGDLYDLVEDYIGEPMPLHVYNVEANQVREVMIVPSEEWGGEGLLGCDVGYGYLHRLPSDHARLQKESERLQGSHKEPLEQGLEHPLKSKITGSPSVASQENLATVDTQHQSHVETKTDNATLPTHPSDDQALRGNENLHTDEAAAGQGCIAQEKADVDGIRGELRSTAIENLGSPLQITSGTHHAQQPKPLLPSPHTPPTQSSPQILLYPGAPLRSSKTHPSSSSLDSETTNSTINDEAESRIVALSAEINASVDSAASPITPVSPPLRFTDEDVAHTPALSENDSRREPPVAMAARMKPGIHGRGSRVGHDGFSGRGKISLADAQTQAQQQSAEYRDELEWMEKAQQGVEDSDPQQDLSKEDKENALNKQGSQHPDPAVHEYMVEGMIRNMALGASVFPL